MSDQKTEKVKIVPNPEVEVETEEPKKFKFPPFPKVARNVIIGATAVAITAYVATKLKNKDEDDESSSDETAPQWMTFCPPEPKDAAASE